jgi:hypothetical protein
VLFHAQLVSIDDAVIIGSTGISLAIFGSTGKELSMSYRHQSVSPLRLRETDGPVILTRASRVAVPHDGWLSVRQGRAWITRNGDFDDWLVEAGERLPLEGGADLLVGPWDGDEPVTVAWASLEPGPAGATGVLRRGAARALHGLAACLDAAARGLDAAASRARGATPARARCAA